MDKYICIEDYKDIKKGDIVNVDNPYLVIQSYVFIYHRKKARLTNLFILEMHFKKEANNGESIKA